MSKSKLIEIVSEDKIFEVARDFGFEVNELGESIYLIKSKHDNWQTEEVYRDGSGKFEIRLNHKNDSMKPRMRGSRGMYHIQRYEMSYVSLLKYIRKHDNYVESNPNKNMSSSLKELGRMNSLFAMIENKKVVGI